MANIDQYTVYNNTTHTVVCSGTFTEVEDYIDNNQYTIVWDYTGYIIS